MSDPVELDVLTSWCDRATTWPLPGSGSTNTRFELLAAVAEADLVTGRLVEAHADAVAISVELRSDLVRAGQRWGVWAAGPSDSLRASHSSDGWRVSGTKAWCSGATLVTHALVDALTDAGQQLFALDLAESGVVPRPPDWLGPGMGRADTRTVDFQAAAAAPVGQRGEYLARPGFWAGAIGVAACWHGGTVAVARRLLERSRSAEDQHLLAHLGAVHVALNENRSVLGRSGRQVDEKSGSDHSVIARSVRATVERNALEVIDRVGRALGPGPLAHDGRHATLVADLMVYVRQHHAERDLEQIGRAVALTEDPWRT